MRVGALVGPEAERVLGGHGSPDAPRLPRVGFLGVGWIGRHRMEAIARAGSAEIAAIADPSAEMLRAAAASAPEAARLATLHDLLAEGLDGVVIATPSALHAEQSIQALEHGVAVFCQKPLGRTASEVEAVLAAARAADRLLAVDLSYRFTAALATMRQRIQAGEIGDVFAARLVFHNAYGPDKPWFYDRRLSGGGCVMDLGIHLIDLALWALSFPAVQRVTSRLYAGGRPLRPNDNRVEDYATALLDLETGTSVEIACSWNLAAGQDAVIEAVFYGTQGALAMRNLEGSFYDLFAERYRGTSRETLVPAPDDWGGRAAADWTHRLRAGERFDPAAETLVDVARVLDRIYQGGSP
jgi:predicted dehydrogenase